MRKVRQQMSQQVDKAKSVVEKIVSWTPEMGWEKASNIGQAISGVVGVPLIALALVAIVLMLGLQYADSARSHRQQQQGREIARIESILLSVKSEIESVSLVIDRNDVENVYNGSEAFDLFSKKIKINYKNKNTFESRIFDQLYFTCETINALFDRIHKSDLPESEKSYLTASLVYLYTSSVSKPVVEIHTLISSNKIPPKPFSDKINMMLGKIMEVHIKMMDSMKKTNIAG